MTKCNWCGMESRDPYVCEWCKRPFTPTAAPPPPGPSSPPPIYQPPQVAQAPGTAPVRILYEIVEGVPYWMRLERFLGVILPLTAISIAILMRDPGLYLWLSIAFFFCMGMALPITGTVSFLDDEDYRDFAIVLLLGVCLCGPLTAMVLYTLATILLGVVFKTDINWSLIGVLFCFLAFDVLFRVVLSLTDYEDLATFLRTSLAIWGNLPFLAIFAGWLFSGFFRPGDTL